MRKVGEVFGTASAHFIGAEVIPCPVPIKRTSWEAIKSLYK